MNYVCQYKRGRRINLGPVGVISPAQARDKALSILADVAKGIDPTNKQQNKKLLLKEFIINEYAPWVKSHRKVGQKNIRSYPSLFF